MITFEPITYGSEFFYVGAIKNNMIMKIKKNVQGFGILVSRRMILNPQKYAQLGFEEVY